MPRSQPTPQGPGGPRRKPGRPKGRPAGPGRPKGQPFRDTPRPQGRRRTKPAADAAAEAGRPGQPERLQKTLAAAGLGSRRQCEELILTGRVEVDGKTVTELGTRVDPMKQKIRVDGETLPRPQRVYFALHKPDGVLSTNNDPSGRPRVVDLIPESASQRLFPVGRLDLHSAGLILVTNDGELANRLTHPRFGVPKTYRVLVAGEPTDETLAKLTRGVYLSEGMARVEHLTIKQKRGKSTVMEMVLREGMNREIRRVMARVGHKVLQLLRLSVGPIRLGRLAPGEYRRLTRQEVEALQQLASPQESAE